MLHPNHLPTALIVCILGLVVLAALFDLAQRRIPNALVLWGLLVALPLRYHYFGLAGLGLGLAGFALALLVLMPFYLTKGLGAGDVKLMAAIGAFLGPQQVWIALVFCLAAASVIGVGYLIVKGGVGSYLRRYGQMLNTLRVSGSWLYIPPQEDEVAAERFPFGVAIAAGLFGFVYYTSPGFYAGLLTMLGQGGTV
ncbi:prepilin peptidase [Motiliproteus sp. SC1-56]|uniref:A24 family peptidase n=1 Tax=Motiliproteus sp. SC1-56 TaxID=2799565 RepID=UPI001A8CD1F5|nr:prepilin peptidase [Motiliproteus sp. SC1-56]